MTKTERTVMKVGIVVLVLLAIAGCGPVDVEHFDVKLEEFRAHLDECEAPLVHAHAFGAEWGLDKQVSMILLAEDEMLQRGWK